MHTWIHSNIRSSIWNNASTSLQNNVAVLISEECLECDFNGVEKRWIVIFLYIHQEKQQKRGNVSARNLWTLLSSKYLGFYRWTAEKATSTKQMSFLKHVCIVRCFPRRWNRHLKICPTRRISSKLMSLVHRYYFSFAQVTKSIVCFFPSLQLLQ